MKRTASDDVTIIPFTTKSFYGSKSMAKAKHKRLARVEGTEDTHGRRVGDNFPTEFIPRILGPTFCWKVFYRQMDAFDFAHSIAEDVHVFSFETCTDPTKPSTGQRRYLASSLPVFWHYYSQLKPCQRQHYEIIPENSPCKLYFDLEYLTDSNPGRDGESMVATLIKLVCAWIRQVYGIVCDRADVLDLDASTPSKFSRHLIFQDPDLTFEDNVTQGDFVRQLFRILQDYLWTAHTHANDVNDEGGKSNRAKSSTFVDSTKTSQVTATPSPLPPLVLNNYRLTTEACCSCSGLSELSAITKDYPNDLTEPSANDLQNTDVYKNINGNQCKCRPTADNPSSSSHPLDSVTSKQQGCVTKSLENNSNNNNNNNDSSDKIKDDKIVTSYTTQRTENNLVNNGIGGVCDNNDCCDSQQRQQRWGNHDNNACNNCKKSLEEEKLNLLTKFPQSHGAMTPGVDVDEIHRKRSWQQQNPVDLEVEENNFLANFSRDELLSLIVKKKDGETLFCDLGVYTKNRNFRLFLSSKRHKKNHLKVADWNQFSPKRPHPRNKAGGQCEEEGIFYASLITKASPSPKTRLLRFEADTGLGKVSSSCPPSRRRKQNGMKTKGNRDNRDLLCHQATLEGWGNTSPYPEIDGYFTSLVSSQAGYRGAIRHWNYWPDSQTLVYDIVGYRWCHNVRRHHKSNNIMYVVDVGNGTYYQKCYDPDCQAVNYRSPEMKLPCHVLPGYLLDSDDLQQEQQQQQHHHHHHHHQQQQHHHHQQQQQQHHHRQQQQQQCHRLNDEQEDNNLLLLDCVTKIETEEDCGGCWDHHQRQLPQQHRQQLPQQQRCAEEEEEEMLLVAVEDVEMLQTVGDLGL